MGSAVCRSVLQCVAGFEYLRMDSGVVSRVFKDGFCSVLQRVAVCCSVLQCLSIRGWTLEEKTVFATFL